MSGWEMKTGRDRYRNDPAFKRLVDMMAHELHKESYTASEMRDAAMTASIMFEQMRPMTNPFVGGLASEIERVAKAFPELDNRRPSTAGEE